MNQDGYLEVIEKTRRYLRHQEELFGKELFLNHPEVLGSVQVLTSSMPLDNFRKTIQDCLKCSLGKTRNHFVFGVGNPKANLMLIGEAPGEDEDLQGEPFVGKAGKLLDKILAAIDFRREEVYIGNILKCRPPLNRDPLPEEIALCTPYLTKQIELIQPKIVLALGRTAAQVLLKTTASLNRLRGMVHDYQNISLIVTYHPAALLRNPQWKRPAWEDVQRLRQLYDEIVRDKPKWRPPRK